MRRNVFNFGHFLLQKGLITEQDMYDARFTQKKRNLRIGEIAKAKDWLSDDDIQRILIIQEDTYIFFGEALVLIGAITEKDLIEQLKEFNKAKFFTQDA